MKFATLFLIASTALALSNGDRSDNTVKLVKKDGGFRFPTEDEDDPYSPNYRFRPQDDNNNQDVKKHPYKNRKDNNGIACDVYVGKEFVDIPEECMKSVFCKLGPEFRMSCDLDVSFDKDNWTKEKLIKEVPSTLCAAEAICKNEDMYQP